MAVTKTIHCAMTLEECGARIAGAVTRSGFSQGKQADDYTVETPGGAVRILVFEKYFLRTGSNLTLTTVLDTVQGGPLRVHLAAAGGELDESSAVDRSAQQKLLAWVEAALRGAAQNEPQITD